MGTPVRKPVVRAIFPEVARAVAPILDQCIADDAIIHPFGQHHVTT